MKKMIIVVMLVLFGVSSACWAGGYETKTVFVLDSPRLIIEDRIESAAKYAFEYMDRRQERAENTNTSTELEALNVELAILQLQSSRYYISSQKGEGGPNKDARRN